MTVICDHCGHEVGIEECRCFECVGPDLLQWRVYLCYWCLEDEEEEEEPLRRCDENGRLITSEDTR